MLDTLGREFRDYQICSLPESSPEKPMEEQWLQLKKLTDECGAPLLQHLPTFMLNVLSIPHSNAACERIFSLVRRNRTDFRASMSVQTLENLTVLKQSCQSGGCCFNRITDPSLLKSCKEATMVGLSGKGQ
ncbi:zinc finger protein 862 [Elysia marginata]|uniref:Zinc finger protein 862 n=1 Tax=Elysia marginata TaxID=1093978 RepID=A0AAV4IRT6_9GAST|nr:zinc finger protein 862 [Elysia marginata]